jgi:TolB protein
VFSQRDGKWQSARTIDADGENPRTESPTDSTILSPVFGPDGVLYYVMSRDYAPFRIAAGRAGTFLPIDIPGSVLGIAISPEGTRAALTVMKDGKSTILTSENGRLSTLTAAPLAHHPAFGPLGKVAYVGGTPVQRVHVDGQAVSPAGFMASAPTFCDTSRGLWLVFTVEVFGGAELVATDSKGGNMRRLTQRQGENRYPACSPDGRLVAFFSTTKTGQGPGLYVMPTGRPWLAKRISAELGQSLRWERLPPKADPRP